MPDMTNQQYAEYVKRKSPTSPLWGDLLRAFLIGGAICALGPVSYTHLTLPTIA